MAFALCVKCSSFWDLCPTIPPSNSFDPFIGYYLVVGRKPKNLLRNSNEFTKIHSKHMSFNSEKLDQSEEFDVIWQQVSIYCSCTRAGQ